MAVRAALLKCVQLLELLLVKMTPKTLQQRLVLQQLMLQLWLPVTLQL